MSESTKRHEENSNLIKEIQASTDDAIRNQGASIKTLEIQIGVSGMPLMTYLNLGLGELAHTKLIVELADRTVKYPKGIAENVLVEARLMGETSVLNRSLDYFFGDYIELNDLNVPLELRRNQVDDLMPTIKECEVVEEFRARNDARMNSAVFEDMDAYRDEGMGVVIFGEPFLREVGINAKRDPVIFPPKARICPRCEDGDWQHRALRTSLKEKKSTMLVENLRSGNFEVLES
ncbi:hypothetical protein Tco_0252381 [Tanacetum coccineum]